ncbi:MAG TPA: hypothetical protein VF911_18675 [Thermoanaerobaculia bacterium]|jgi:fibronectin type 3 domain-containing protein
MRRALAILFFFAALPLFAATERVSVVFEPGRGALLRWPLPAGPLPASFRVERREGGNRTTIATLQPGTDVAALRAEDRDLVARYQRTSTGADANAAQLARTFATVRSVMDLGVAKAFGIFAEDAAARAGATVTYDVYAGDALFATSGSIALAPTAAPAPPAIVIANATRDALTLTWEGDESSDPAAAVTYLVYRRQGTAEAKLVSTNPILAGRSSKTEPLRATFIDRAPVLEQTVSYAVVSRDAFGRTGPAGTPVDVLYADFAALDAPRDVKAATANGAIRLSWTAPRNANRAGWRVVRALNSQAAGDVLTPTPLAANEFSDSTATPGVTYYYRVSAVNARGEEGSPSPSVQILARLGRPPAAPASIDVALAAGKVLLEWAAVPGVIGYRVERALTSGTWGNVTGDLARVPRFEDRLPMGLGGALSYRVFAIGADGTPSEASRVLTVTLPDTKSPLAPVVLAGDGAAGKATLRFRADGRADETAGLFVLRSNDRHDNGTIVHASPLPANATTFIDEDVTGGATYYYRLVAIDAAGNRSDPSSPAIAVTIGAPPVTAPAAPRASYQTAPFPHVAFTFPAAPKSVRYVVQREEEGTWLLVAGPLPAEATSAIDTHPRTGSTVYRLTAVPTTGGEGTPSVSITVAVP